MTLFLGLLSTALFTGAFCSTAFASYILEIIEWRYFYSIVLVPSLSVAFIVVVLLHKQDDNGKYIHNFWILKSKYNEKQKNVSYSLIYQFQYLLRNQAVKKKFLPQTKHSIHHFLSYGTSNQFRKLPLACFFLSLFDMVR